MGQSNISARHRELGAELRKRRLAAEVTVSQVSEDTGWHRTKVARVESGRHPTDPVEAILYLGACGVDRGQALDLLRLCREAEHSAGYWASPNGERVETALNSLIYHESTASSLIIYEPMVVNGLLQTADYARTLIARERWRDAANVANCVEIRLARQEIVARPRPAGFTFFLHEQALRNEVGSGAIMHEQLLQVVLLTGLGHVRLADRARCGRRTGGIRRRVPGALLRPEPAPGLPRQPLDRACSSKTRSSSRDTATSSCPLVAEAAWDEGQSRRFVAALADEFDRGSRTADGIYELEEEQL